MKRPKAPPVILLVKRTTQIWWVLPSPAKKRTPQKKQSFSKKKPVGLYQPISSSLFLFPLVKRVFFGKLCRDNMKNPQKIPQKIPPSPPRVFSRPKYTKTVVASLHKIDEKMLLLLLYGTKAKARRKGDVTPHVERLRKAPIDPPSPLLEDLKEKKKNCNVMKRLAFIQAAAANYFCFFTQCFLRDFDVISTL